MGNFNVLGAILREACDPRRYPAVQRLSRCLNGTADAAAIGPPRPRPVNDYWAVAPAAPPGRLAPELEPDSGAGPELPLVPEPMLGHGCLPGAVDFDGAEGCGGVVGVVGVWVVDVLVL